MEIKGSHTPIALPGATENSLWAESVGSNTGLDHCERRNISSNSFDTEASSSCNFEPKKHRRKVLRKMAEDPDVLRHEEQREERRTQYFNSINANLNSPHLKRILEVAARVVNYAPLFPKSLGNPYFSEHECLTIEKILCEEYSIDMPGHQVQEILHALYFKFGEYCRMMKEGRSGVSFYWESGGVCVQDRNYQMHDPIVAKFHSIQDSYSHVILNFDCLKRIFHFIWDKYFKEASKKRSGSGIQSSSSRKRSRSTFSMKSSSSIDDSPNVFGRVIARLQELFGDGPSKYLPKEYANPAMSFYGANDKECYLFLALDDDAARGSFLSKMGFL